MTTYTHTLEKGALKVTRHRPGVAPFTYVYGTLSGSARCRRKQARQMIALGRSVGVRV